MPYISARSFKEMFKYSILVLYGTRHSTFLHLPLKYVIRQYMKGFSKISNIYGDVT